jgi:hypothetical protein
MSVRRRGEEGWGPGDLLTMVLVRWQFARLLHFTRLVVAVMDECGDFGESLFSETTEIESRHQGGSSFHRYYTDVMGCASSTPYPSASEERRRRHYYTGLLRGCFLIAFLHDPRVRRFTMAHHSIFKATGLPCTPTNRAKANAYLAAIHPTVEDFLQRTLSLHLMSDTCVGVWREDYMFHHFAEAVPHYRVCEEGKGDTPQTDHPQRSPRSERRDCDSWSRRDQW